MESKRLVMVLSFREFRDSEYFIPKQIFEDAGIGVKTASVKPGTAVGAEGGEAEVDLLVSDVDMDNFDAVIFIGGPGCLKSLDNQASYGVLKEAEGKGKIIGSICISPVILAKSGILEGKKATVWTSIMDKSGVKELEKGEAEYRQEPVVVDGKIITADGPKSAQRFGETIVNLLTGQD